MVGEGVDDVEVGLDGEDLDPPLRILLVMVGEGVGEEVLLR